MAEAIADLSPFPYCSLSLQMKTDPLQTINICPCGCAAATDHLVRALEFELLYSGSQPKSAAAFPEALYHQRAEQSSGTCNPLGFCFSVLTAHNASFSLVGLCCLFSEIVVIIIHYYALCMTKHKRLNETMGAMLLI